jgi:hypothetical protein
MATVPTSAAQASGGPASETTARTIPVSNLTITPGTITPAAGADPADSIVAPAKTMLTTSQALISAPGANMGTYTLTPTFSLAIPANTYRSNYIIGTSGEMNPYTSTITYTIG